MSSIKKIKEKYYKPQTTASWLRGKKIDLLDLELIISRAIKKPREFILTHPEYQLNKFKIKNLKLKIARRAKGVPLAYIFGYKEFYGLQFKVNKNTLIPRPETELIIDEALILLKRFDRSPSGRTAYFIDIGTGSGCIIIALAKLLSEKKLGFGYPKPSFFLATDISKKALSIASQNARVHNVNKKIKFLHGNLLEPILEKSKIDIRKSKILITANLPYLTPKQIKKSPTIKHEPKLALSAGNDGLKYYRRLFKQIKELLPVTCHILLEIDPTQTLKLKKIINDNFPKAKIKIKKDLRGHDRVVIINIKN